MRTLNSRAIDDDELAWLRDVKSVLCAFCNASAPTEGHHAWQGLHFMTISACHDCHDARVWNIGGMTEAEAVNETIRRVLALRAGKPVIVDHKPMARRSPTARPEKVLKGKYA